MRLLICQILGGLTCSFLAMVVMVGPHTIIKTRKMHNIALWLQNASITFRDLRDQTKEVVEFVPVPLRFSSGHEVDELYNEPIISITSDAQTTVFASTAHNILRLTTTFLADTEVLDVKREQHAQCVSGDTQCRAVAYSPEGCFDPLTQRGSHRLKRSACVHVVVNECASVHAFAGVNAVVVLHANTLLYQRTYHLHSDEWCTTAIASASSDSLFFVAQHHKNGGNRVRVFDSQFKQSLRTFDALEAAPNGFLSMFSGIRGLSVRVDAVTGAEELLMMQAARDIALVSGGGARTGTWLVPVAVMDATFINPKCSNESKLECSQSMWLLLATDGQQEWLTGGRNKLSTSSDSDSDPDPDSDSDSDIAVDSDL